MDDSSERMRILELIESGQISTEDGLRQLAALQEASDAAEEVLPEASESGEAIFTKSQVIATDVAPLVADAYPSVGSSSGAEQPVHPELVSTTQREDFERWKGYWMIPLWIGVGVTIVGGLLMYWALQSAHVGFWFFCATIPFILGVLVLAIAAGSRNAHWLHLRVQQAPGERPQRIAISFPIPIGLAIWFLRTFRGVIPGLNNVPVNLEDMLQAVRESTSTDQPLYIHVDDEEDGEKVEIFIG